MTIFQKNSILSDVFEKEPIPLKTLAYFRGRLGNRIHELVLELFSSLEQSGQLTRAELGRRIDKAPEQITRWLGSPGNWTKDTLSDLVLGMGYEPVFSLVNLNTHVVTTTTSAGPTTSSAQQKTFETVANSAGTAEQNIAFIYNMNSQKSESTHEPKVMSLGSVNDVLAREREKEAA